MAADATTTARVLIATVTTATAASVVAVEAVTAAEAMATTGLLVAPRLRGVATALSPLAVLLLLPVTTTTVPAAPTTRNRRLNAMVLHRGTTNKTGVL